MKICHLSSAHPPYDNRIFLKQVKSLQKQGHVVYYIGSHFCISNEKTWIGEAQNDSRLIRMTWRAWSVVQKGLETEADLFHLHDPELLPFALWLKMKGKTVVYDAHEDLPRQLMFKTWISAWIRKPLAVVIEIVENFFARRIDAVIGATPLIVRRFKRVGISRCIEINNYPYLGEFHQQGEIHHGKCRAVCYVGAISQIRGIAEVVKAMEACKDTSLYLVGEFESSELHRQMESHQGWMQTEFLGQSSRDKVKEILSQSLAGIVTFHPVPNHIEAQPNKLFEYMSAAIPVIASDFPLWNDIIEGNRCGICVDPLDPMQIANAIQTVINNPEAANEMGRNGRAAVERQYNWEIEQNKLFSLYDELLQERSQR